MDLRSPGQMEAVRYGEVLRAGVHGAGLLLRRALRHLKGTRKDIAALKQQVFFIFFPPKTNNFVLEHMN